MCNADCSNANQTVGPFAFRYQGNGATPCRYIEPLERQLIALQLCRWQFLQRAQCSHCKRCISYGNSVRLSVCPSHAGIVSKRRHVARCSLHLWIAKCVCISAAVLCYSRLESKLFCSSWISGLLVHLDIIQVKFEGEGHMSKFTDTGGRILPAWLVRPRVRAFSSVIIWCIIVIIIFVY